MGGWSNKFYDCEFSKFVSGFDILFLQETWVQDIASLSLQGFQVFAIPAIKVHSKGRGSGGLAVLVAVDLIAEIQILESSCPNYIQALLIKGPHLGSLLCINVYVPPKLSMSQDKGRLWDQLSHTLETLTFQFPNSQTIVYGDFNARIGPGLSDIRADVNFQIAEHTCLLERRSQDPVINKPGLKLLELLSLYNL